MRVPPSPTPSSLTGRRLAGLATAAALVASISNGALAQGQVSRPPRVTGPALAPAPAPQDMPAPAFQPAAPVTIPPPTPAPARLPAPVAAPSADAGEIHRLMASGQSGDALKLIDAGLAKNPKDPILRFRRGVALSMLDRRPEAIAVFQKLTEDYPGLLAPYNNLAVLYGAQGEYEKARVTLEKAIRTNPEYATAYQNLGDVYAQLASQAYTKALQLDKSDRSVGPKLALLREIMAGPATAPVAAVPAMQTTPQRPTQVAAAATVPAPAPAYVPVPASTPAIAAKATPTPAPAPAAAPVNIATAAKPLPAPPAPAPAPVVVAAAKPAPAPAPVVVAAAKPAAPAPAPATAPAPAPAPAALASTKPVSPAPAPVVVAAASTAATVGKPAAATASASSKPAPAASAAIVATVAKPASATTPAAAPPANTIAEIESAVRAWAAAWSRRDVPGYVAAYTPDFSGSARSHHAWEEDRKARIAPRKRISVEISELRVSVNGDKAEAHFKQTYRSDTLDNTVHKTLSFTRSGGKWLIRQESVGG